MDGVVMHGPQRGSDLHSPRMRSKHWLQRARRRRHAVPLLYVPHLLESWMVTHRPHSVTQNCAVCVRSDGYHIAQ
jgi:hypothetical protein